MLFSCCKSFIVVAPLLLPLLSIPAFGTGIPDSIVSSSVQRLNKQNQAKGTQSAAVQAALQQDESDRPNIPLMLQSRTATSQRASDLGITVDEMAVAAIYSDSERQSPSLMEQPGLDSPQLEQHQRPLTIAQTPELSPSASRWSLSAEAVFFNRSISPVTTTLDLNNGSTFGTESLDFDADLGARISVNYRLNETDGLEFSFLGFHQFSDSDSVISSIPSNQGEVLSSVFNPEFTDPASSNFAQAFSNQISYSSRLSNLELNYLHQLPQRNRLRTSFIAGFRYLNINEGFDLIAVDEDPDIFPDTDIGSYSIETNNHLFGVQIGINADVQLSRSLTFGLQSRLGLFLNSAEQSSTVRNVDGGTLVVSGGDRHRTLVSPLLELGAFLRWEASSRLSLQAGYRLLLVGNLALAPDQFATSSDFATSLSELNTDAATYYGPFVGVTVRF